MWRGLCQVTIMQEVWQAVIDENTCPTCRALHGQVFEEGEGPQPPLHEGCRCNRVPVSETAPEGLQPRRAMPTITPKPLQPVTPPSGLPGTVVGQVGKQTLVAPPEPPGGIKISMGGREVGRIIGEEFVSTTQQPTPVAPKPAIKPAPVAPIATPTAPASAPISTQPFAPPSGLPGTVVGQVGRQTLVAPPEPLGGVKVSMMGREVGRIVGGEWAPGETPQPQPRAERVERPEMANIQEQIKHTASSLKEWRGQIDETRKVGKDFLAKLKDWAKPPREGGEEKLGAREAVQARMIKEFTESRKRLTAAGWQDPYAGAFEEMQGESAEGRAIRPTAWDRWSIRGQIAGLREQLESRAPSGTIRGRGQGLASLAYGMYAGKRMWGMTGGTLSEWMGEYAGADVASRQAQFALGGTPQFGGPMQDIMTAQAGMANRRFAMGQAAFQNWGWTYGLMGQQGAEPGFGARALTMGMGAIAPWAMLGTAGQIATYAGAPALGGAMSALTPLAGAAGAGMAGAWAGGEISNLIGGSQWYQQQIAQPLGIQYQATQGLGDTLGRVGRFVGETGFLAMRGARQGLVTPMLERLGIAASEEDVRQREEGFLEMVGLGGGRLSRGEGFRQWMGYQVQPQEPTPQEALSRALPQLNQQQLDELRASIGRTTGIGEAGMAPGAAGFQLAVNVGERAQLMGYQGEQQYLSAITQAAGQMGAIAGQPRMVGLMGQMAQLDPTQFLQAQAAAPVMGQINQLTGMGMPVAAFSQAWAGLSSPQQRRFSALMGGNQMLWSQLARTRQGRAMGIPETVAASGLSWGTEQQWGIQDEMTAAQRQHRDIGMARQREQFQWAGEYQTQMFGIEDATRAAQRAHQAQGFAFQEQGFAQSQRQWQESFGLGKQIFETRVGWQAEDVSKQRERMQISQDWRFADLARSEAQFDVTSGWKREDLQRSIRYSTGRQRIEAERQLQRYNVQAGWKEEEFDIQRTKLEEQRSQAEEDFETSKQRNEELIALQRERYDMQQRHHEEDAKLQAERFKETVAYYEQQKQLEDERVTLTRENWEKQREWQAEALDEQEAYNKLVDDLMDAQRELTREQQKRTAEFQKFLMFMDEKLKKMDDYLGGGDTSNLVGMLEGAMGRYLGRMLSLVR